MRPPVRTRRRPSSLWCRRRSAVVLAVLVLPLALLGLVLVRRRTTPAKAVVVEQDAPPAVTAAHEVATAAVPTTLTEAAVPPVSVHPPVVLVLGMHHSMTSIATKLLLDMGLFAGERSELLLRRDNPFKYFEHAKAVAADQEYFDRTLAGDKQRRGPYDWLGYNLPAEGGDERLGEQARALVTDLVARAQKQRPSVGVVIKDPRMSLVADPWLRAAREATNGTPPVCLILVRDPRETAVRFLQYNTAKIQLSAKEWMSVWEQYTFRAFASCEKAGARVLVIRNDELALRPRQVMRELVSVLGNVVFPNTKAAMDVLLEGSQPGGKDHLLPKGFEAKHEVRFKMWNDVKDQVVPSSLVSVRGWELWRVVEGGSSGVMTAPPPQVGLDIPAWVPLSSPRPREGVVIVIDNAADVTAAAVALIRSFHVLDTSRKFLALLSPAYRNRMDLAQAGWKLIHHPTTAGSVSFGMLRQLGLDRMLVVSLDCVAVGDWRVLFEGNPVTRTLTQGACRVTMFAMGSSVANPAEDPGWTVARSAVADATTGLGKVVRVALVELSARTSEMAVEGEGGRT